MMESKKLTRVAIGIVMREGQILICERPAGKPMAGYWEFPGGKIEPGESAEECVQRELREEVAVEVNAMRALSIVMHEYEHGRVSIEPFVCQWTNGEPRAIECAEVKWVTWDELGGYTFPPANESIVSELRQVMAQKPVVLSYEVQPKGYSNYDLLGRFWVATLIMATMFTFMARVLLIVEDESSWLIGLTCWVLAMLVAAVDVRQYRKRKAKRQ